MPTRRPAPTVDVERLMKRVEAANAATSEQILAAILPEITALKLAVLKGNMEQGFLASRLSDVELQINQGRDHAQVSEREHVAAAQAVAATAVDTAQTLAKTAPKNVWKTKLGMVTASSAAFVAVVAFFNNLPKFVRGAAEMASSLFAYIVRHR